MKSNLEKYYETDIEHMINNKGTILEPNPYYQVNKFISNKDNKLTSNYLSNLETLNITNTNERNCLSCYNPVKNELYSKNEKADVYGLLYVASNDINKPHTGVITEEDIGYGLNNGITDLFTSMINGKRLTYPIEAITASVLYAINDQIILKSYFENDHQNLVYILKEYKDLLVLLDSYHDNYLELFNLYKDKFLHDRYYHNLVYGTTLKANDETLKEIENKIYTLESSNYTYVADIITIMTDLITNSGLNIRAISKIANDTNSKLNKTYYKEEFYYLLGLKDRITDEVSKKKKLINLN